MGGGVRDWRAGRRRPGALEPEAESEADGSVLELAEDVACKVVADFPVARNRLTDPRSRILVPVVPPAVSEQHATRLGELTDQFDALHGIWSSATRRTPGMLPLVSSL